MWIFTSPINIKHLVYSLCTGINFFKKNRFLKILLNNFGLIIYVLIIPISWLTVHVVFHFPSEFGVHLAELTVDREGALAIRQVILKFIGLYVCFLRSRDSCEWWTSLFENSATGSNFLRGVVRGACKSIELINSWPRLACITRCHHLSKTLVISW